MKNNRMYLQEYAIGSFCKLADQYAPPALYSFTADDGAAKE
ncbi:MAG: hypothetical protein OFPI_01380 [Osedax symbiont Rs2]|nr:MAG: hypothetical protein OFPI_01380 [Osedax symbiont Rs2]